MGVLQTSGELDLAEKAVGAERLGELRMEHLEGDGTVVAKVVGQVHYGHSASAELAFDAVVLRECCLQTSQQTGQNSWGSVALCYMAVTSGTRVQGWAGGP